ncbi:hypothetical protein BDN70DRAFT_920035 [Pholiota conissans]|uniref:F-box domain-containing protein n=1 Tax=Pholiota conissans TaxID=109636 RepID=A0A9P6D2X5_9AGAR|nr:hypothetical protein BDN70DRAFT_920035 [Pholiota conissans]
MPPIFKLHPELLSIIFEMARDMTHKSSLLYEPGEVNTIAFEITVTRICSYFQRIALAAPRLWTSIHLHGASHPKHIIDMLTRSGECWLDIRIDMSMEDLQMNAEQLDTMVSNFILHSRRWRSLCIAYSCERRDHPMVMKLCSSPAPGLQQLSISVDDVVGADGAHINHSVDYPVIFRDGAPNLASIRLRGFAVQLFRPPFRYVVILHLDQTKSVPIQYATLKGMLTLSPHLAHVSIYGDILGPGDWVNQPQRISLPALRSLRMYSISGETFSGVLQSIEAPNLESLTMKSLQDHDLRPLWDQPRQIRFEALKTLNLIEFNFSAPTCRRIFETFEHITAFSAIYASSVAWKPTIVNILTEGTVNWVPYVPWPKLKTLHLSSDFCYDDNEGISTLIAVRKAHGYPIHTLVFKTDPEEMEDTSDLQFEVGAEVEIRFCQDIIWPENSTHIDLDDVLFY